ncbi:MAG: hypothetical protein KC422_21440 [Trueperaceae bacterium]|nr:hypothetical protein [Trueperaceae bacterium]
MRENTVRTKFQKGEAVVNGWLQIPSGVSAEVMAMAGFDSLTLDLQHGLLSYDTALPVLQAVSITQTIPIARVPWNEPGIIMKMLDAGSYGIICPMVNTADECAAFVRACRYPPKGYRSFGPTRASMYAGDGYAKNANDTVLTFAMIETAQALDNLDAILSVDGLDAIYVGPADLSQSLGGPPGADWEEGKAADAVLHIVERAKAHGIYAGIHTGSVNYARKMIEKGYQFVTLQSDLGFLRAKAQEIVDGMKDSSGKEEGSSPY